MPKGKSSVALIDLGICRPEECNPGQGVCAAVSACSRKVIVQIDGPFEVPMLFQDTCMGCGDCIEACPLGAISKHDM